MQTTIKTKPSGGTRPATDWSITFREPVGCGLALSEALSNISYNGIDGVALEAVISNDPTKIEAAKAALLAARKSFMGAYETLPFPARRNLKAQIASAAQLLH